MTLSLLYQWINFAIFIGTLVYFLREPLRDFLGDRRARLKKEIEEIMRERLKIEAHFQEYRKKLTEADAEIQKLMGDLKKEGEFEKQLLLKKFGAYAEKIKQDASKIGGQELNKAKRLLKKQALLSTVEHAKIWLEKIIDSKDQQRLVGMSIENLEKKELGVQSNERSHLS